jgi:hypothetical protein
MAAFETKGIKEQERMAEGRKRKRRLKQPHNTHTLNRDLWVLNPFQL